MPVGDPAPFDAVASRYDELYRDRACQAEDRALRRLLRGPVARSDGLVLDVGCGTGWFPDHLAVTAAGYVGFDLSEKMVAATLDKHPDLAVLQGDLSGEWHPLLGGRRFDLVVSLWCAASYAPPWWFARQTAAHLRPGGEFFLMPHALGSSDPAGVRGDAYLPAECYGPSTGWAPWTKRGTLAAFRAAGLDVSVRNFCAGSPWVPESLPVALHSAVRALKRVVPADRAAFLLVTGRKP